MSLPARPAPEAQPVPRRVPWYLRPFFGRGPLPPADAMRTLYLVSAGLFFENYDIGLVNAVLPQMSQELGIATGDTAFLLSAIRIGGIGTLLLIPLADLIGRRRVFLLALIGMSVGTLSTAFAQTPLLFAATQMFTRTFMLLGAVIGLVIVVEEFPAEHRAAGVGLLGMLGGLGFGLGAGLYALVDVLPYGWRALYGFGIVPLALVPFFRKQLAETHRFEAHRAAAESAPQSFRAVLRSWFDPFFELARTHPRRVGAVGLVGLLTSMGFIAFFQYTSYFVQNVHGWAPGQYTLLVMGGGLIGVTGNVVGGRGSDRFGRRRIGVGCLVLAPLFVAIFFHGPPIALPFAWGFCVLCTSAADIITRTLSAELFPTSHRGTSSGFLIGVQTIGWTLGLLLVGLGTDDLADLGRVVSLVSLFAVVGALGLLLLPETQQRELEAISGNLDAERPG